MRIETNDVTIALACSRLHLQKKNVFRHVAHALDYQVVRDAKNCSTLTCQQRAPVAPEASGSQPLCVETPKEPDLKPTHHLR